MDIQFKNSHGRFQSMITAARLLQAQRWKDPTLRTGLGYCGGNFPADGHKVLPLAIYCTYLLDGKILAAVLIGDLTIHRIACEASGIGSAKAVFLNLATLRCVDFNSQNPPATLAGEFWELKSTLRKVAKVEKHCNLNKLQEYLQNFRNLCSLVFQKNWFPDECQSNQLLHTKALGSVLHILAVHKTRHAC